MTSKSTKNQVEKMGGGGCHFGGHGRCGGGNEEEEINNENVMLHQDLTLSITKGGTEDAAAAIAMEGAMEMVMAMTPPPAMSM